MSDSIQIVLKAIDEATGTIKAVTVSLDSYEKEIQHLIDSEKRLETQAAAQKHFEKMTDAEKSAFVSTKAMTGAIEEQEAAQKGHQQATQSSSISITDFNQALEIGTKIMQVAQQVYAETIDVYMQYAQSVRDLSMVSGQSAENTSRFIQVLDDFRIGADDAMTATKALTKQGLAPTTDTLAKLSDQYLAITDTQERNEFVLKNLGKSGLAWNQVLSQGSAAIRENAAAQSGALVMTKEMLDRAEDLRLKQDALADSTDALKIALGQELTPAVAELTDWLQKGAAGWAEFFSDRAAYNKQEELTAKILKEQGVSMPLVTGSMGGLTQATKEQIDAARQQAANQIAANAALENSDTAMANAKLSAEELAAAQQKVSESNSAMVGLIQSMQSAEDSYTKSSSDLAQQRTDAEAKLIELRRQGYWEQSEQIQGALGKVEEIKQKEAELAEARDKQTLQFISNLLLQRLEQDGFTTAEFEAFAKQQEAWGLWSADTVAKAQAAWMEADKVAASIAAIPSSKESVITVTTLSRSDVYATEGIAGRSSTQPNRNAAGGNFVIPNQYGVEGFRMGNGDTASAGEGVSITPAGNVSRTDELLQQLIGKQTIDYNQMARVMRDAMMQAGK